MPSLRALLASIVALGIGPAGSMTARAQPAGPGPQERAGATIQGKTVDQWLDALKDRDPAVRERAVEVLGERSLDPAVPEAERLKLGTAINGLMLSDKDGGVRDAAASFSGLERMAGAPEMLKLALEERKRIIKPTAVPIRLVDAQGKPVAGAVASSFFWKDADRESSFTPGDPNGAATSDARGELRVKLEVPGHLDAAAVYAMHGDRDHLLVGLRRVSPPGDPGEEADHRHDASGMPGPSAARVPGLPRAGGEVPRRPPERLVAVSLRLAG